LYDSRLYKVTFAGLQHCPKQRACHTHVAH